MHRSLLLPHVEDKYIRQSKSPDYPRFHIKARKRCWRCNKLSRKLRLCNKCKHVHYCSVKCLRDDKERHNKICRDNSFYHNSEEFTIKKDLPDGESILSMAISLIDKGRIHPNNIYVSTNISRNTRFFYDYLNRDIFDLRFFLERGLDSRLIADQSIITGRISSRNLDILLEYSNISEKLTFPLQDYSCNLKWFFSRDIDMEKIISPSARYYGSDREIGNISFLASVGFDFNRPYYHNFFRQYMDRSIDQIGRKNLPLADEIMRISARRSEVILNTLNDILIPDLANLVIRYLKEFCRVL